MIAAIGRVARANVSSVAMTLFSVIAGGIGAGAFIFSIAPTATERAFCDEAVHQVLTTKDPVELQRNMFLVRRMNCSISRRLP